MDKRIMGIDIGYGHVKCISGINGKITKMFKFPSVFAEVKVNDLVSDDRVIKFDDRNYYVGDDALALQSSSIIDIKDYAKLEFASPVLLFKALSDIGGVPDVLVLGLSITQIHNSGHYRARIEKFLLESGVVVDLKIVPQGAATKLTIDKYGVDFPNPSRDFNSSSSYVLCDIGFNTLDIAQVLNGQTSTNLVRGIAERGIQVIVSRLIPRIEDRCQYKLTMSEAKSVVDTGILRRRGVDHDFKFEVEEEKATYLTELTTIVENEFGSILDKVDNLILVGGGAYIFKDLNDSFIKAPVNNAEYYNAAAYFIYGSK